MIEFTPLQLKQAQEDGLGIDTELNDTLKKYTVLNYRIVHFHWHFQKTLKFLLHLAVHQQGMQKNHQIVIPTTKLVLEEIAEASSYKEGQASTTSGAKRSLEFPKDLPADTLAKHATKTPEQFAKEPTKSYSPPGNIKDSSAKKAKANED
ncbi:uncharacterized protein [Coffea arabica]|uniref:Uncharacterized protein isoform X2 n=1 Tax=Coffea arabica TaxID=13443 RepID=A0ABM4U3T4_COFAR